jgi:hypothetical protein
MKEQIKNWLVFEGGIIETSNNHFGGDPSAVGKSKLNLKMQQRPGELATLIDFFIQRKSEGEKLKYYAEIGACAGGTTYAINHFLNFEELLIIDDGGLENEGYLSRGDQLRGQNLKFIPRVEIIGSSMEPRVIEMAKQISKIRQYDILFIDGDHSYNGVKNDTLNYISIVRGGGYLIFHDTEHIHGIRQWVNEFLNNNNDCELVMRIAEKDDFTDLYTNGIGLTIIRKK